MSNNNSSTVNDQTVDAVSHISTMMVGSSAPQSMGLLDVTGAESMGISMHNAVSTQHNSQISSSAAVTAACAKMLQTNPMMDVNPAQPEGSSTPPPPPFMPLGPDNSMSADSMLKQANRLAEAALAMMNESKTNHETQSTESQKDLDTLSKTIASIKGIETKPG